MVLSKRRGNRKRMKVCSSTAELLTVSQKMVYVRCSSSAIIGWKKKIKTEDGCDDGRLLYPEQKR